MTPVSSNDEKHASDGECNACDDRSRSRHLEGWDLSGDEPDTGKQDQQEATISGIGRGRCVDRLRSHRLPSRTYGASRTIPQRAAGCRPPGQRGHPTPTSIGTCRRVNLSRTCKGLSRHTMALEMIASLDEGEADAAQPS
jgi:hypothetical protein